MSLYDLPRGYDRYVTRGPSEPRPYHEPEEDDGLGGPMDEEPGYPRVVNIICPDCGRGQEARVHFYVGDPFPSHGHQCDICGYYIGESEWDEDRDDTGEEERRKA